MLQDFTPETDDRDKKLFQMIVNEGDFVKEKKIIKTKENEKLRN